MTNFDIKDLILLTPKELGFRRLLEIFYSTWSYLLYIFFYIFYKRIPIILVKAEILQK